MHSSRNFALQEHGLENSEANLKKLSLITTHLEYQLDAIDRNSAKLEEVTEQVRAMQRWDDSKELRLGIDESLCYCPIVKLHVNT